MVFDQTCKSDASSVKDLVGSAMAALKPHLNDVEIDGGRVRLALTEAATNALFHGNLDLEIDMFGGFDEFQSAAKAREKDTLFNDREVGIRIEIAGSTLTAEVLDEGHGFQGCAGAIDEADFLSENARGLWIIQQSADKVEWDDDGRIIRMIFEATRH